MRFEKKEIKKALTVLKRVVKDKKEGTILITLNESGTYTLEGRNPFFIVLQTMPALSSEPVLFTINPYELEGLVNGCKNPVIDCLISDDTLMIKETNAQAAIKQVSEKTEYEFQEGKAFRHPEKVLAMFKEVEGFLVESEEECSRYVLLDSKKAIVTEPRKILMYRIDESFGFSSAVLAKEVLTFLKTTVKAKDVISHSMSKMGWVIENGDARYIINVRKKVTFPDLRKTVREKALYSFSVSGKQVQEAVSKYTKKCPSLQITLEGNHMTIDPRSEEFSKQMVDIHGFSEDKQIAVFSADVFKSFFSLHEQNVVIEHQVYTNIYGDQGYLWHLHTPEKMVTVAGITEPDISKAKTY